MNGIGDRLARLAALRPRGTTGLQSGTGASAEAERLVQRIGGESQGNRFGGHVRVHRRFAHPKCATMEPRALRRIVTVPGEILFDSGQWLFLDTETTGLAGGTGTYAFLVGLAWWEEDGFIVEQFFMRDHGEEPSLLFEVLERLARRRVLITFNGKSFDWPLLQTRYRMTRVGEVPEPLVHLDLLHPARRLWRLQLKSVSLTQLEREILHFDRGEDIPSETIPQIYFDFLRGGSSAAMAEVFRHNQMDLCGLASLALHISSVLVDPEQSHCSAGELFGISRLLQSHGEDDLAGRIYRRALESGLPRPAERVAQRELALLAKRGRNFELSNALWEKLLDDSAEGLKAYEQLAIYYEHHAALPRKAALLSREALVKIQEAFHAGRLPSHKYRQWHASFQHRLARLTAKTAAE